MKCSSVFTYRTLIRSSVLSVLLTLCFVLPASSQQSPTEEEVFWSVVREANDPAGIQLYLRMYDDGAFADEARQLLKQHAADGAVGSKRGPDADGIAENNNDTDAFTDETINPERCDTLAEHPLDHDRYGEGVAMEELKRDPQTAITACLAIASSDTLDPYGKYAFQLSRAYHANAEKTERAYWVEVAARKGWKRAIYRRGMMVKSADNINEEDYLAAARDLEVAGLNYPHANLEAASIYWKNLGGFETHQDHIFDLVSRAHDGGAPDAHYYFALIEVNGDPRLSKIELLYHLAKMIEHGVHPEWAKRKVARNISKAFEGRYQLVALLKSSHEHGNDEIFMHEFVENNSLQFLRWALEAVSTAPEDKMERSEKLDLVFQLMTVASGFSVSVSDEVAIDIMVDLSSNLCRLAAPTNEELKRIRPICHEITDGLLEVRAHLKIINQAVENYDLNMQRVLSDPRIGRLKDCVVDFDFRAKSGNQKELEISGFNQCSMPLVMHYAYWTDLRGPDRRYYGDKKISANGPFHIRHLVQSADLQNYHGVYYINWTSCHPNVDASEMRRKMERGKNVVPRCILRSIEEISGPNEGVAKIETAIRKIDALLSTTSASEGHNQVGISASHCALIVASRKSIAEVDVYISNFNNTEEFDWSVYEASNGWMAIAARLVAKENSARILADLKAGHRIPEDSFCSDGDSFVRLIR